jgi:FAD/FMN-containing dehydrogenase
MTADEGNIPDFKGLLRGELIRPEDDRYDAARTLYNAMIDKRPAMIVRCAGAADVIAAVNLARDHDLPLAVRAGGHSVAGKSMCDEGVVIDLSPMKGIRVDPVHRTARAEGGVTWGEFDHETQAFGLATTGGIVSTTGIAGLTLGGGIGYLNRKYGLTCDNLLSADVVTADGRLLTANTAENADLFWALRGGGGNFGVVTSLEYRLHPVGPVLAGLLVWPLPRANEVLRFYREFSVEAPDELRLDATLVTTPDGPALAMVGCWCGAIEAGERLLKALRGFGPPVVDTVAPVPYRTIQGLLESLGYVPGLFHYWRSSFFKEFSEAAIATMVAAYPPAPAPLCALAIEHLGGAVGRVGDTDTAFSHRRAQHSCLVLAAWTDPAESETNIAWARKLSEAMQPYLEDAVYVNYLGEAEGENRVRAAYGANYERLAAIKNEYDPSNLFRSNQNIRPTT